MELRRGISICRFLLVLALAGSMPFAHAQEDKKASREREALKRAQQALRQSEDENAALKTEKAALEQKLAAATAAAGKLPAAEQEAKAAGQRAGGLARELTQAKQGGTELQAKLDDTAAKLVKLGQEHTEALRTIASRDSQIKQQQNTLMQTRGEITACEDKNLKLYTYGDELAQRYRQKSAFDALRQAEPFTGLEQARIDNVIEEYRDKLDAQKIRH